MNEESDQETENREYISSLQRKEIMTAWTDIALLVIITVLWTCDYIHTIGLGFLGIGIGIRYVLIGIDQYCRLFGGLLRRVLDF